MTDQFTESPFSPDDTQPTYSQRPAGLDGPIPAWRRMVGLVSLLTAAGLTMASIALLTMREDSTAPGDNIVTGQPTASAQMAVTITPAPGITFTPEPIATTQQTLEPLTIPLDDAAIPTLEPAAAAALLDQPIALVPDVNPFQVQRGLISPFTIIPDRPRDSVIQYTVVQGDTINDIAARYGLEPETIAWSNSRRIIQVLRPGDVLNIPPTDGVFTTAIGTRTLAEIAAAYQVSDAFVLLNHPANAHLSGLAPESVPPSGSGVFGPGGVGEQIAWFADIEVSGGGGSGSASAGTVRFQAGDPGDCGPVAIGGGSFWSNPIPSGGYTLTRGYSGIHPGIDLAGATGTPIAAANGGYVIFAGPNNYGYGNLIVLIHGAYMTVYGHLSTVNVGCGQYVESGQTIGTMGSTGNSSGPHLHFEVRAGASYATQDPMTLEIAF